MAALHRVINTNGCIGLMCLVIGESNGKYSQSAFIIRLNKKEPRGPSIKGLSSQVLKLFITAYKVITQAQLLVYVKIPTAGAGGINKLWQIPCIYNHLPPKPTKPQLINRMKHSGTKWSNSWWLTGCYLVSVTYSIILERTLNVCRYLFR